MGMGLRRRFGRRNRRTFGRRRRRIGTYRRRRRRGGTPIGFLLCCVGGKLVQYKRNEKDLNKLQAAQMELVAKVQQQQQMGQQQQQLQEQQQQQIQQLPPDQQTQVAQAQQQQQQWPATPMGSNTLAEEAKELQEAQNELLNDILAQQAKEKDPEKLQKLFEQQNQVLQQMQQLQTAGFQYQNGIPEAKKPDFGGTLEQPAAPPAAAMY